MNGKALANHLNLKEMDASDMVDVLHYYFEEDQFVASSEQAEVRSKTREHLYGDLYNRPYKYVYSSKKTTNNTREYIPSESDFESMPEEEAIKPFSPSEMKKETIPFTPVTDFNPTSAKPFGDILDAPLGG